MIMKRPTLYFKLRIDRFKNEKHPIVIKLYFDGNNKYINSPFTILKNEWNPKKERAKYDERINAYLDGLSNKLNHILLDKIHFSNVDELSSLLLDEFKCNYTINYYVSEYIKNRKLKNDVSTITISGYERMQQVLKLFLIANKNVNILLSHVNTQFVDEWDTYLKSKITFNGKRLELNTINKYHSIFRTVLIHAFNEGTIKLNPYSSIKLRGKPTHRNYLTNEEISKFKNNTFEAFIIEKVRLIYLFSCYTGIRFEDAQHLKTSDLIKMADCNYALSFVSKKASKQQEIPILDDALNIILEIKDKFKQELNVTKRLLPKISNQKFNLYIKEVANCLGIQKSLSHHTARHTFATYMITCGVSLEALQVLLGHSNLRETMIYAKITPSYLAQQVKKGNALTQTSTIQKHHHEI